MAVLTMYASSRKPGVIFMDKAKADAYDKMLEVAESMASLLRMFDPSLSESQAEELGIKIATNREVIGRGLTKKPELLSELLRGEVATPEIDGGETIEGATVDDVPLNDPKIAKLTTSAA